MRGGKRKAWRISVHAKAKSFDLKLRATQLLPASSLFRLSFLLRFRAFFLQVKSESLHPPSSSKSKFDRLLGKFRRRHRLAKNISDLQQHPQQTRSPITQLGQLISEGPLTVGSLVIGGVALVSQLMPRIIGIPTILCSLAIALLLIEKKFMINHFSSRLLLITIAAALMACCWVVFDLNAYLRCVCEQGGGCSCCSTESFWKSINSSSKVIFSRCSQYVTRGPH